MRKTKLFKNEALRRFCACVISLLLALNANAQVSKSLWVGETYTCDATSSTLGSITDISWSSSGGYISLSGSGLYRTVKATQYWSGTASVTCSWRYTLYYGGKQERASRTWYFTCTENPVSIYPTSMEMTVGETRHVSYSHRYPNSYTSNAQAYFSCTSTCVSVSNDGTVTALKPGTAYINVYSKISDASNAPYCKVTVKEATPTGISLPNSLSLIVGESKTIAPTVYPSGANYSLTWTSSDETVATVSSGTVYGKKEGKARIKAKINGYNLSDSCDVTVKKPTLTLKVNPEGGLLEKDSKVTLTASNNAASIYYTLDGNTPNNKSLKYNAPISISKNLTLKAIACHPEYYDSEVLTADYQVTSLKIVSSYPENGAENMGRNTTYSATFNSMIQQGDNFSQIKMLKNNTKEIEGQRIIVDNILYFVPSEELETGIYKILLPYGCVRAKTASMDMNINSVSTFSVVQTKNDNIVEAGYHTILYSNGDLYRWGDSGQYTYPDPSMTTTWTPCLIMDGITEPNLGSINSWVLKSDGTLWGWGGNGNTYPDYTDNYLLGDGTKSAKATPVLIAENVKKMINGGYHHGFISDNNSLWLWGQNRFGQIGNGQSSSIGGGVLSPYKVMDDVQECALGSWHTVALKTDGSVWVWGDASAIGTSNDQHFPIQKMTDAIAIASGSKHVLVLKSDHSLWGFGVNDKRQLGDGTLTNRTSPVKIMSDVKYIGAGGDLSMAIKEDGSLWYWGRCNGVDINGSNPHKILDNVISAKIGGSSCMALTEDGTLYGMGDNLNGDLGLGSETKILEMTKITDNVSNYWGEFALKQDGSLWGWGYAPGTGEKKTYYNPVKIKDATVIVSLEDVILKTQKSNNLFIDEQIVFQSQLTPANSEYTSMTWSVDDEDIATISQRGVLTAKAVGTTTVRLEVETEDNKFVRTQKITVMDKPKAEDKTLEIAKYATFYDSQSAYTLPSGLTASVVTGVNNEKLTYKVIAEGGKSNNVIPKGVAVMLTSKKEGTSSYTLKPTDNDATYGNTNWLKGSDEATTTTSDGGNSWFYKLSYGPSGSAQSNVFGWYWGAANGGAFSIAGHKAWLAVPTSAGAKTRSYIMEDEATSIADVEVENPARTNDNYYDLQGRHIPKPTSKGIYIHHGKKYIVK